MHRPPRTRRHAGAMRVVDATLPRASSVDAERRDEIRSPGRRSPSRGARARTGSRTRCLRSRGHHGRRAPTRTASIARTAAFAEERARHHGEVALAPSSCDDDVRKTSGHSGHGFVRHARRARARHELELTERSRRLGGSTCRRSPSRCRRRRGRRRACPWRRSRAPRRWSRPRRGGSAASGNPSRSARRRARGRARRDRAGARAPIARTTASNAARSSATSARRAAAKVDALGAHLLEAPIDEVLFELEVGDAVAKQPADAIVALEHGDVVAGARELLRGREPRGAGADDRRRACRSSRARHAARDRARARDRRCARSIVLMVTGSSSRSSTHDASHGAGQTRPVTSGKLFVAMRGARPLHRAPARTRDRSTRGSRLPSGQPWWQNGMPQSMQRDACARTSSSAAGIDELARSRARARRPGARASSSSLDLQEPARVTHVIASEPRVRGVSRRERALVLDAERRLHEARLARARTSARSDAPLSLRVCCDVLFDERAHDVRVARSSGASSSSIAALHAREARRPRRDVRDAAAHARAEVAAGGAEHDDGAAGHVLAAVIADALDDGGRAAVAHGEALARAAGEERAPLVAP